MPVCKQIHPLPTAQCWGFWIQVHWTLRGDFKFNLLLDDGILSQPLFQFSSCIRFCVRKLYFNWLRASYFSQRATCSWVYTGYVGFIKYNRINLIMLSLKYNATWNYFTTWYMLTLWRQKKNQTIRSMSLTIMMSN